MDFFVLVSRNYTQPWTYTPDFYSSPWTLCLCLWILTKSNHGLPLTPTYVHGCIVYLHACLCDLLPIEGSLTTVDVHGWCVSMVHCEISYVCPLFTLRKKGSNLHLYYCHTGSTFKGATLNLSYKRVQTCPFKGAPLIERCKIAPLKVLPRIERCKIAPWTVLLVWHWSAPFRIIKIIT